jgi:Gp49-like protein DUF891
VAQTPERERYVVKTGPHLTIEFYYGADGHIPAEEFYNARSDDEKRRLFHILEQLTDYPRGRPLPKTMFNEEDAANEIYAVKPFKGRYLGFFAPGGKFIICDTYLKQTQKVGKREKRHVKATITKKKDYSTRVKLGVYYEPEEK